MKKSRTCPACGYRYSVREYLSNLLFKILWSEWECPGCNNLITFNVKRRFIVAMIFGLWYMVLAFIRRALIMTPLLWVIYVTLFIAGSIIIFSFDSFDRVPAAEK
jgi:CXXC-20-CXXC protein